MYHFRNTDTAGIIGTFSLYWLNLSPYYIHKEAEQERTLKLLWTKMGSNMKLYNDLMPKSKTSSSIDKETWSLYAQRNNKMTGITYAEEDSAPYLLPDTLATRSIKKIIS